MGSLRLHSSLGKTVIERLRTYVELPSHGVVAGQAVASVLDHLQGMTGSPVNDIDIFRLARFGLLQRTGPTAIYTVRQQLQAQVHPGLDYRNLDTFLTRMRSYRVNTVSRQGLLNFVNCRLPFASPLKGLSVARVINSFDLNCVRVGVDLATGELVWDRHYQNYLKTRRIEISTVHTPWHTFLRALKKSMELPDATLDLEAAATIVTTFAESQLYRNFEGAGVVSDVFGPKLLETAQSLESSWAPYFRLDSNTLPRYHRGVDDLTVSNLKPRGFPDERLQKQVNGMHNASLHFIGPVLHNVFKKPSHKVTARMQELDYLLSPNHAVIASQFEQDPCGLSSGHVSAQHLDTVSEFLRATPEFCDMFAGLTLDEQFEASKALTVAKTSLPASEFFRLTKFAMPADLKTQAAVQALIVRLKQESAAPLHAAVVPLPRVPAPWATQGMRIVQLRSLDDITASKKYGITCDHVWPVRAGREALIEITTEDNGETVTSSLEFRLEDGRPVALTTIQRPVGLRRVPARHALMRSIILAHLFGSPRVPAGCKETCEEDDLPF